MSRTASPGQLVQVSVGRPRPVQRACWKLDHRMSDATFVRRFTSAGRPGAYLRIVTEGILEAGDSIRVEHVPDHGVTVADVARIHRSRTGVEQVLALDLISDAWKAWAVRVRSR